MFPNHVGCHTPVAHVAAVCVRVRVCLPHTAVLPADGSPDVAAWREWVEDNVARGCDVRLLLVTLAQHGVYTHHPMTSTTTAPHHHHHHNNNQHNSNPNLDPHLGLIISSTNGSSSRKNGNTDNTTYSGRAGSNGSNGSSSSSSSSSSSNVGDARGADAVLTAARAAGLTEGDSLRASRSYFADGAAPPPGPKVAAPLADYYADDDVDNDDDNDDGVGATWRIPRYGPLLP